MKKIKNATEFKQLERNLMGKIQGGVWVEIIIDGQRKMVWLPD